MSVCNRNGDTIPYLAPYTEVVMAYRQCLQHLHPFIKHGCVVRGCSALYVRPRSVPIPELSCRPRQHRFRNRVITTQVSTWLCHDMSAHAVNRLLSETLSCSNRSQRSDGTVQTDPPVDDCIHDSRLESCRANGSIVAIVRSCIFGCCCGEWFNRIFCACNILIVWDSIYVDSSLFDENI